MELLDRVGTYFVTKQQESKYDQLSMEKKTLGETTRQKTQKNAGQIKRNANTLSIITGFSPKPMSS